MWATPDGSVIEVAPPPVSDLTLNWPPTTDGSPRGPSERQRRFFRCMAKEQLYGGSKRGGKTVAGCAKGIYLSYLFPGNKGYMLRNSSTDLKESTLTTFWRLCPPALIAGHIKSDHTIFLYTRERGVLSQIVYSGLGEDSDFTQKSKDKAKSKECGWFHLDEPSEASFEAFKMLVAQLCWYLPDGSRPPYMALLTSNPEPGWVKDRYIDENSPEYILNRDNVSAEFIPSLPRDNPGLPPGWESDLRATEKKEWVDRYLDGSWDIHEGMVFDELRDDLHNLDRYLTHLAKSEYPMFYSGFNLVSCLDHASTGITACLQVGLDSSENVFALEEYYKKDDLIVNHAARILAMDKRYPGLSYRLIDPSCKSKVLQNRDEMISVQEAYRRAGVDTALAYRTEIAVGLDELKTMLVKNPLHINPFTQERGSPRLFISRSRCPMLWKEMIELKKERDRRGDWVFKGADHAIDDLRYIIMSRPGAALQKEKDLAQLPTVDQIAHLQLAAFDKKFGKEGNSGSWF